MLQTSCPHCQAQVLVEDQIPPQGLQATCAKCQQAFIVPPPAPAPAAAPPPPVAPPAQAGGAGRRPSIPLPDLGDLTVPPPPPPAPKLPRRMTAETGPAKAAGVSPIELPGSVPPPAAPPAAKPPPAKAAGVSPIELPGSVPPPAAPIADEVTAVNTDDLVSIDEGDLNEPAAPAVEPADLPGSVDASEEVTDVYRPPKASVPPFGAPLKPVELGPPAVKPSFIDDLPAPPVESTAKALHLPELEPPAPARAPGADAPPPMSPPPPAAAASTPADLPAAALGEAPATLDDMPSDLPSLLDDVAVTQPGVPPPQMPAAAGPGAETEALMPSLDLGGSSLTAALEIETTAAPAAPLVPDLDALAGLDAARPAASAGKVTSPSLVTPPTPARRGQTGRLVVLLLLVGLAGGGVSLEFYTDHGWFGIGLVQEMLFPDSAGPDVGAPPPAPIAKKTPPPAPPPTPPTTGEMLHGSLKELTRGLRTLAELREQFASRPELFEAYAIALLRQSLTVGDSGAREQLDALLASPQTPERWQSVAVGLAALSAPRRAPELRKALKAQRDDPLLHWLDSLLWLKASKYPAALKAARTALALDPRFIDPALTYLNALPSKKPALLMAGYKALPPPVQQDPGVLITYARTMDAAGKLAQVEGLFAGQGTLVGALSVADRIWLNQRQAAQALQRVDLTAAHKLLAEVAPLAPADVELQSGLARVLEWSSRPVDAASTLDKLAAALSEEPAAADWAKAQAWRIRLASGASAKVSEELAAWPRQASPALAWIQGELAALDPGQRDKAVLLLRKASADGKHLEPTLRLLALQADDPRKAVAPALLARLRKRHGEHGALLALEATTLLEAGKAPLALRLIERAQQVAPWDHSPLALVALAARCQYALGQVDKGLALIEPLAQRGPRTAELLVALAQGHALKGRYGQAAEAYRAAAAAPGGQPAHILAAARAYIQAGAMPAARDIAGELLKKDPQDHGALAVQAETWLSDDPNKARRLLLDALAAAPRQPDYLVLKGNAERALRHTAEAIADYERALALNPRHSGALRRLVSLAMEQDDWETAVKHLTRLAKLEPRAADVPEMLGDALLEQEQVPKAIASLRRAEQLAPRAGSVSYKLGLAHKQVGKLDLALQYFEAAARKDPANPQVHYQLGYLHKDQGRYQDAIRELRAYLRLRPDAEDAEQVGGEIRDLSSL